MKQLRLIILILSSLSFLSCASYFKRKECEKINWFIHGEKVAMKGTRLNSDSTVKECKKAEANINEAELDLGFKKGMANYCKFETAFAVGKRGDSYNTELCDPSKAKALLSRHNKGVLVFCSPKNAYAFAAKGGIYNGICPEKVEAKFKSSFKKGRIKFLKNRIIRNRKEITGMDSQIRSLRRERSDSAYSLDRFRVKKNVRIEKKYDSIAGSYIEKRVEEDDPDSLRIQKRLQNELNSAEKKLKDAEAKQDRLQSEILKFEEELGSLQ